MQQLLRKFRLQVIVLYCIVNIVVLKSHTIKGQRCDVKKALPREEGEGRDGGGRGGGRGGKLSEIQWEVR